MLRYEYKYLVPNALHDELRKRINPFVEEDRFAHIRPQHQYTVRSIYFDTSTYRNYHEKVDGIERRKKIRIRGYDFSTRDENRVFLEIKRKYGAFIIKNRAPARWSDLEELLTNRDIDSHIQTGPGFENAKTDARQFFYHVISAAMRPVILVTYEREAFYVTFDRQIRITFDKNIRFRLTKTMDPLFEEQALLPLITDHFVLELKFHEGLPEWMLDILTDFGLQRRSFSKYTLSLERALKPQKQRIKRKS